MNKTSLRILLVEDNPADALLLQETLAEGQSAPWEPVHVQRLADALVALTQGTFDVVLLDLGLPDSQGMATFLAVQARVPQVPIIVLSGLDDEDVATRTVAAGAQDYLIKGRVPLDLLARAIRYAVERKRVGEELRRRNLQLQEDLDLAREFQLAFLPQHYPSFPPEATPEQSVLRFHHLYLPSGSVGGDFYDILQLGDRCAGVFICDVMGHGVRAALVTAIVRGLVEELKPAGREPGRFLAEMNRSLNQILRQTATTMFATAAYLVVDAAAHQLQYASAGHPSPIQLRRPQGPAEFLPDGPTTTGPVLGLFAESVYHAGTARLRGSDLLVLYTDGLFEVVNDADEAFGQSRLLAAVQRRCDQAPADLLTGVVADAQRHAGAAGFEDDICVLGVEVGPG